MVHQCKQSWEKCQDCQICLLSAIYVFVKIFEKFAKLQKLALSRMKLEFEDLADICASFKT